MKNVKIISTVGPTSLNEKIPSYLHRPNISKILKDMYKDYPQKIFVD
tara:strand:- start:145 stop:285 length:141 start_codon:yes stop_codon:yes gene_type:complete